MMIQTTVNKDEGVIEVRSDIEWAYTRLTRIADNTAQCEHEVFDPDEVFAALDVTLDRNFDRDAVSVDDVAQEMSIMGIRGIRCTEAASWLVTICDAPELRDEPDDYLYCAMHAKVSLGNAVIIESGIE